jgi:hypothetical protein
VDECVLAEQAERGQVKIRGGHMLVDEAGLAQVSAEVFNPGTKPVLVNGLMAGVYDEAGKLIAADNAAVATRYLAPGESGPVRATLDLPPGGAEQIKTYQFFKDVLVNDPGALPQDVAKNVQTLSQYSDQDGHFHLIGQISNPGPQEMMVSLQATVYADANKSEVVDAATFTTWIPLAAGETRPFDITEWGALNNVHGLWDEVKQGAVIEVRVEPFSTWAGDVSLTPLSVEGDSVSFTEQKAVFTGKVKTDAQSSINNGLVVAVVRQKSSGEIVATGTACRSPLWARPRLGRCWIIP